MNKLIILNISIPTYYRYEGWLFEWSRNKPFGPWPCRKDFTERERAGRKFYEMFERFYELSEAQQDEFEVKE